MSSRRLQRFLLCKNAWSINWKSLGWLLVVWIGMSFGLATAKEMPTLANLTGKLPLYFVSDDGPGGKAVYQTLSDSDRAYFTSTGVWLTQEAKNKEVGFSESSPPELQRVALHQNPRQRWALKLEFLEAREVTPQPSAPTGMKVNYFRGRSSEWRSGVETYGELVYANLWSGVDLHYSGEKGRLKSTFTVKPGADPRRIQLAWRGAERVALTDAGRLRVETPLGIIEEEQPIAWQERADQRVPVSVDYAVEADPAGGWRYGFKLGSYDPALPLVIDPVTLGYSIVFGPDVSAQGIAVDHTGAAYITGTAKRASLPPISGVITELEADKWGIFIAKLKPDGSGLVYVTFLGDDGNSFPAAIAVDETGAAYITGSTYPEKFPIVGSGLGTSPKGMNDAFVAKISSDGSKLVYAGLLGGGNADSGHGIAVDSAGAAYVTGITSSNDFPTVGNLGSTLKGQSFSDAFVAKIQPDGAGLAYAGYLGGDLDEWGTGIAVDKTGAAYITGSTTSRNFPVISGLGATLEGYQNAFIAKVKPDGSGLAYAGYLGGYSATGIAVDSAGAAYVTGSGNYKLFPAVAGFNQDVDHSLFIAKVQPEGLGLAYVGFVGGSGTGSCFMQGCETDWISGIAVDAKGVAYVTGITLSKDFPTAGRLDAALNGRSDAFWAKVKPDGSGLISAGYLGGNDRDGGRGIAVDGTGSAYILGYTNSSDFPVVGSVANPRGGSFIIKLTETAESVAPVAVADQYTGYINQRFVVAAPGVLGNDLNPDKTPLTASLVKAPSRGVLRLEADGGFSYDPLQTDSLPERFEYVATNQAGSSAPAIVMLNLVAPAEAVNDSYLWIRPGIKEVVTELAGVLANDLNIIPGMATVVIEEPPAQGRLTLNPNGGFTYTANQDFSGTDSFTYAILYGTMRSRSARVNLIGWDYSWGVRAR